MDEDDLVAIEIDWDKRPLEVQQTRLAFTGELLDKKHFSLSLSGRSLDNTKLGLIGRTFGHKAIIRVTDENAMLDLVYDRAVDKLSLRLIDWPSPPKAKQRRLLRFLCAAHSLRFLHMVPFTGPDPCFKHRQQHLNHALVRAR